MTKSLHKVYVLTLTAIVVAVFLLLTWYGTDYYALRVDERHFHEQNEILKPSGLIGHGAGVAGSVFMITGVFGYMARKRIRKFYRIGILKHWLEFHIFLCTLGPVLVLYHTSFKFGGLVAISFWSMVAVVVSGIIGRFIYLQIPRTIEGRELSLNELKGLETELYSELQNNYGNDIPSLSPEEDEMSGRHEEKKGVFLIRFYNRLKFERKSLKKIREKLKSGNLSKRDARKVIQLFRRRIILERRIGWLDSMQNYLRYWHVAHLPFALVMLLIMLVHVAVAVIFGYKWIF